MHPQWAEPHTLIIRVALPIVGAITDKTCTEKEGMSNTLTAIYHSGGSRILERVVPRLYDTRPKIFVPTPTSDHQRHDRP